MELKLGEYSDWIKLQYKAGLGIKVTGIARVLVKSIEPHFSMYVTPINIDPEKPVLPISYPGIFSVYHAKLNGSYSTLGLAEDTWALNERVIDEDDFLKQAYDILGKQIKVRPDDAKVLAMYESTKTSLDDYNRKFDTIFKIFSLLSSTIPGKMTSYN